MWTTDIDFSNAVHRAARALSWGVHATLRAGANDGDTAALVKYLRSDVPIGQGERELLAELIAGELGKPDGRPPNIQNTKKLQDAFIVINERIKQYRAQGIKKKVDEIVCEVAIEHGFDPEYLLRCRRKQSTRHLVRRISPPSNYPPYLGR
jgi:hypothetical protein